MLTIKQAAEKLNVSEKTVRNLVGSGVLEHHRIGAGRGTIRVSEEALADYLASTRVAPHATEGNAKRRHVQRARLKHLKL